MAGEAEVGDRLAGQELQALLARSKEHLRVLGDEFNQKVGSWRATNDSLRAQTEQLKGHVAQSQDHWEALRKEKTNQISALRQELAEWEARIKNDAEEFERNGQLERQTLIAQVRQQETNLQDTVADYEGRLKNQEEEMTRASEEIRNHEQKTEDEWHAALEQWQKVIQALQELVSMQNRFQTELRQTDDAMAKLKMEITFKETHAASQKERLAVQLQRDLDPLRDRLARLTREEEDERNAWEVRLHAKEDELKMLKTRLTLREKRIQDEHRRRTVELDKLRKQLAQETESARAHYEAERSRLEKLLLERREDLARLAATETDYRKSEVEANSQVVQAALRQKHQLEESLRQILAEREALREHYESLMADRDANVETHQGTLDVKEQELEAIREHAKDETHTLHKKMELLRQIKHKHTARHGPTNAAAWNTFEVGVHHYQSQQWAEAVQAFEDCLQKDPRWGAAYQYLALAYHAQGNTVKAAETAVRAKELDPGNTHLTSWVNRLQAAMNERKAS